MNPSALAIGGSILLAALCFLAPFLSRLPNRYQASLFSMSSGAGLSYVFLYLLFELTKDGAPEIHAMLPLGPNALETLFILLLFAVASTYVIIMSLQRTSSSHDDHHVLAILILLYNFLAGIGLAEEAPWGRVNLALYAFAIGLHLLSNELYLSHCYAEHHNRWWRTSLGLAPILGCTLAIVLQIPKGMMYGSLALVAGVTIINVFRYELPSVPGFRPLAFIGGVLGYAAFIFATWRF